MGDDEAAEGFVVFASMCEGVVPFTKPFIVLHRICEGSVGEGRRLFDELEGLPLCRGYGVWISMLRTMRNDLLAETVGDVETMSCRRKYSRIGFVLFI